MPELPEVRVVSKFLRKEYVGKKIKDINVLYQRMMSEEVKNKLIGQEIKEILTLGKYIIFKLTDYDLISHLRMEGKYYLPLSNNISKHDHIIFYFDDKKLIYNDVRKFGTFDLREKSETLTIPPLSKLGKEPFIIENNELYNNLKKRSSPIKSLLLNQHIISGIGNIYADEILFKAKIHPLRKGNNISKNDTKNIVKYSIEILNAAIKKGGTTLHTFKSNNQEGWFSQELNVHLRENLPCNVCSSPIQKIKVGGRSSYFCQKCQEK